MALRPIRSSGGLISGFLSEAAVGPDAPLLACIHGGGCNSGYFNIRGHSTVDRAQRLGFPVLLIDRPGHGGSAPIASPMPIADSVPIIQRFIEEVQRGDPGLAGRDLVMIGHSIGGAVVLSLAALAEGGAPLRAVAVSGIGDEPTPAIAEWWRAPDPEQFPPGDLASSLFLGPEGSYGWQAPIALRASSEPWQLAEVGEVMREWPRRWPGVAARIEIPVHLRLAEHDRIWRAEEEVVARMADRLLAAPEIDSALLPEGGHLYEIHKRGPELVDAQLAFLRRAAAG